MKSYFPTINLLRGLAAAMVCIFHFVGHQDPKGDLFPSTDLISRAALLGAHGVHVFFVVSGFVIPLSLWKNNFQLRDVFQFLFKRFIRIEIPYLVSIALVILIGVGFGIKNNLEYEFHLTQLLYHFVYVIPFSQFEWYNVIYWTLAIEFQFYITLAFLYVLLSSRNVVVILITLVLFGASNIIASDSRFIFHYSTIFVQGIILFLLKTNKISNRLGTVLLACSAIATAYLHSREIAVFALMTALMIHFVEIDTKWSKKMGDISFSLYLTHGLIGGHVLYFLAKYANSYFEKIGLVVFALFTSLWFAYLFWWLIEKPSIRMAKKQESRQNKIVLEHNPKGRKV